MSTSIVPNQELHPNEHRPFWSNWRIWAAAVARLFALGISILFGSRQAAQLGYFGQRLFPPKEAFDFNLINQDAQPVQLHQLRGKVVLFLFGFTHCPNVCPASLTNFAAVYQKLEPEQRKQVQIMFLSLDTQRDTPAALNNCFPRVPPTLIAPPQSHKAMPRSSH